VNRLPLAGLLVLAVGVSACGEQSKPAPPLTVVVTPPATAPAPATQPATTTSTSAGSPTTTTSSTSTSAAPAPPAGKVITRAVLPQPPRRVTAVAVRCLKDQGLVHVGAGYRPGVWLGKNPVNGKPVFVDGPYKNRAAADRSAKSLHVVESAERGGMFVVSATIPSRLGDAVHAVAKCLNGTS